MSQALRTSGRGLLGLLATSFLLVVIVRKLLDRRYYRGPKTGHFDGQRFANPDKNGSVSRRSAGQPPLGLLVRYLVGNDDRPQWPKRIVVTPAKPAVRVTGESMVATWVGHATVLIQTQGLNILTDPVWARTAGPFGIGPQRVAEPGIQFADLPKIDLVLVSHGHYDHMDVPTLRQLWARDRPLIVTSLGNDAIMTGVHSVARDWGERVPVRPGIDVIVSRNHHWSSRWFSDHNRALWSSFVVTLPGGNLFFAGDTGFGDGKWPAEAASHGQIRLALIPIGAFRFKPGQMTASSHIGPIDAAEVFDRLGASSGIGIHWGTFRLSYEAYDTPPKMLAEVMKCRGQTGFVTVSLGKPVEIAPFTLPREHNSNPLACQRASSVTSLR
jgi:L-ascorbate metabolism protein UlaG (beta-lactamase superfamily)